VEGAQARGYAHDFSFSLLIQQPHSTIISSLNMEHSWEDDWILPLAPPIDPPTIVHIEHAWQQPPGPGVVEVYLPWPLSTDIVDVDFRISTSGSNNIVRSIPFIQAHNIKALDFTICRFPKQSNHQEDEELIAELIYWGIGSPIFEHENQKEQSRPNRLYLQGETIEVYSFIDRRPMEVLRISERATHNHAFTPLSNFNSPVSFKTASSYASFKTARSAYNSPAFRDGIAFQRKTIMEVDETNPPVSQGSLDKREIPPVSQRTFEKIRSDYRAELNERKLLQPLDKELNWSGRGQHVVFEPKEKVPLDFISHLGASATARVEMVRCRRVALARKTMRCKGGWHPNTLLQEVSHLQSLQHFHIVQLVGTYLQGRDFSLLMYPAADCHLGTFMEDTEDLKGDTERSMEYWERRWFLIRSLCCLASAVECVHRNSAKHMDIKPQNILVKQTVKPAFPFWQIYLSDFGLSRSFADQGHSQTDGPTSLTPKYCAPEVYEYELRGRSSDIFSLGCVYTEMLTVVAGIEGKSLTEFVDFRRNEDDDESFHKNLKKVTAWMNEALLPSIRISPVLGSVNRSIGPTEICNLVLRMLCENPVRRPSSTEVVRLTKPYTQYSREFQNIMCCGKDPETYVVYNGPPGPLKFSSWSGFMLFDRNRTDPNSSTTSQNADGSAQGGPQHST
jgi:serine/threonine protein kinase